MKCRNCLREIPDTAKACQYCEAPTESETDSRELGAAALAEFERLPPDEQKRLRELAKTSSSAEAFTNSVMVGNCPDCGSSFTGDCEDDPEVGDNCVGRCFKCGFYWCLECGQLLDRCSPHCSCSSEDEGQ